jgi:hypothetical protein
MVQGRGALTEVADQDVADRPAPDPVVVDELPG